MSSNGLSIGRDVMVVGGKYKGERATVQRLLPVMVEVRLTSSQLLKKLQPRNLELVFDNGESASRNADDEVSLLVETIERMSLSTTAKKQLIKKLVDSINIED
jgi:hypothetical protein